MVDSSEQEESSEVAWSPELDTLLAKWCDQAKCFEWMHNESYTYYERKARQFMISINCLTAISGLSNVIAGGYTSNGIQLSWVFGSLSILVSTLNILQDKLGFSQQSILHKKLAGSWSILISKIEEIIVLPYGARQNCRAFLKYSKADMNQFKLEGHSLLPKHIREACFEKFKTIPNFDIPDICGHMEHTARFIQPPFLCSDESRVSLLEASNTKIDIELIQ
jgi:hypothetical protein